MTIEYVPLKVYDPLSGVVIENAQARIQTSNGLLRLIVDQGGCSPYLDICLDGEDLWRAWQAVKPTEDWP